MTACMVISLLKIPYIHRIYIYIYIYICICMVLANPTSMLAMRTCTRVFANALVTRTCIRIFANVLVMRTCTRVFANALVMRTCIRVFANVLVMRTCTRVFANALAMCTCIRVFANALGKRTCTRVFANALDKRTCARVIANALDKRTCARVIANALAMRTLSAAPAGTAATVHSCTCNRVFATVHSCLAYLPLYILAHMFAYLQTCWPCAHCSLLRTELLPLYILAHIFACLPLYTLVSRICHCTFLHIYLRICKRVGHAHMCSRVCKRVGQAHLVRCSGWDCCHCTFLHIYSRVCHCTLLSRVFATVHSCTYICVFANVLAMRTLFAAPAGTAAIIGRVLARTGREGVRGRSPASVAGLAGPRILFSMACAFVCHPACSRSSLTLLQCFCTKFRKPLQYCVCSVVAQNG